jgi:uncharacterized protein (TIRG00374 family)
MVRGSRLTAGLYTLAFLAVCNLAITCVRVATAVDHHPQPLRLLVEVVVGVGSLWWAVRRTRGCAGRGPALDGVASSGPEARRADPQPVGASSRGRVWLCRARQVAVPALMVLAAISVAGQWGTVEAAMRQLGDLHWRWVRWAVYAEALSIVAYACISRAVLRAGHRRISMGRLIAIVLASNALATSVPGGPAWAATFTFEQYRRRGVARGLAVVVLGLALVASIASLIVLMIVGVDVAGTHGPAAAFRPLSIVTGVALAILLALVVVRPTRRWLLSATRRLPSHRCQRLSHAVQSRFGEIRMPRITAGRLAEVAAASLINWLADCGCLVAAILAVSGHVPWDGILVIYAVTQIAENLPLTPGGIGVVEGTLSLMLVAYGLSTDTAVAAVLVYRIISFWILVALGWLAAGGLTLERRRTVSRRVPAQPVASPMAVRPIARARPTS